MSAIEAFAKERARHEELGYTSEHDAHHPYDEFVRAGQCYAAVAAIGNVQEMWDDEDGIWFSRAEIVEGIAEAAWPWERDFFHPSDDTKRNLQKAGALLAAAYDTLEATE